MKIQDILSEAYSSYKPGYDADTKKVLGRSEDWLKAMNVTPEDLAKAVSEFKKTAEFKYFTFGNGVEYTSSKAMEKHGTFRFKVDSFEDDKFNYLIYANGQIRRESSGPNRFPITRLTSPKPHLVANDPVRSLVTLWSRALKELTNKWQKKLDSEVDKIRKNKSNKDQS